MLQQQLPVVYQNQQQQYGQPQNQYQQPQTFGQGYQQSQQVHRQQNNDECNCCEFDNNGECFGDCCDCSCKECGCDGIKELNCNFCQSCPICHCFACCFSADVLSELKFKNHNELVEEDVNVQLTDTFKKTIAYYKFKSKIQFKELGECVFLILKNKNNNPEQLPQNILLKNFWFKSLKEFQNAQNIWSSAYLDQRCPYNINIYGVYTQRVSDICVDRWRISILFQDQDVVDQRISQELTIIKK